MAEKDENSMIGYDPLVWLHEDADLAVSAMPENAAIADDAEQQSPIEWGNQPELFSANSQVLEDEFAAAPAAGVDPKPELHDPMDEPAPVFLDAESGRETEAGGQLALEAVQNMQNVAQLHQHLLTLLDTCHQIDIDASAVTQIDTATLQLLLVLKRTAVTLQKEVNIDFPSEKFAEAAHLLGLAEMLSVDQAASGFF